MDVLSETKHTSDAGSLISEMTNNVFHIEHLREQILGYVIYDKKQVVGTNTANCRLVNKTFLNSVSRILLKNQETFLKLGLGEGGFKYQNFSRYTLDKLITVLNRASRVWERIPPLGVSAFCYPQPIWPIVRFSNCLVKYGSSLTNFTLSFSEDQAPSHINISGIHLPNLRAFRIDFQTISSAADRFSVENKINLIQSVFDACEKLQTFSIIGGIFDDRESKSLRHLIFPATITELILNTVVNDSNLEVLVGNSFPNLELLNLAVNCSPFNDGLKSRVLENFRKTLKHFAVHDIPFFSSHVKQYTTFSLPLMEKLESLEVNWRHMLPENVSSLQQFVPKLNDLRLVNQKPLMLQRWTDRSCFDSVTCLEVSLAMNAYTATSRYHYRPKFNWDMLQSLKTAFPNVLKLDIKCRGEQFLVFKFLVTEMRWLQQLRLVVDLDCADLPETVVSPAIWDSIFIGIAPEHVGALKLSPELWSEIEPRCGPCIRNMADLHTLELDGVYGDAQENRSLISAATFNFAFLQMPKLRKLVLKGDFFASEAMEIKWQEDGRFIENYISDTSSTFSIH